MKKWLYAFSALVLSAFIFTLPTDYTVQAAETVSPGDVQTIPAPQWVDNSWSVTWKTVDGSGISSYKLNIYENNTLKMSVSNVKSPVDISSYLVKSGASYAVSVSNPEGTIKSEISTSKVYKEKLATPTNMKWDGWTAKWDATPNAKQYSLIVFKNDNILEKFSISDGTSCNIVTALSSLKIDMENGAAYRFAVQAVNPDYETSAVSTLSESRKWKKEDDIETVIQNIVEVSKDDAEEARKMLMDQTSSSELRDAMQSDSDVRSLIQKIENYYVTQNDIKVSSPTVSSDAKALFSDIGISTVGLGLNADEDSTIVLQVSLPSKKASVDTSKYKEGIQLDIKAVCDGSAIHGKMQIPITITMRAPKDVDLDDLVLLHYFDDESGYEKLDYYAKDGWITFTVRDFSTFVFTEKADGTQTTNAQPTATPAPAKDVVPKTGDGMPFAIAIPMIAAVCLTGAALVLRKREG